MGTLTPGARANGSLGDFFAGAIAVDGVAIVPFSPYVATFGDPAGTKGNLGDQDKAGVLVLGVYGGGDVDDRAVFHIDVLWMGDMLYFETFPILPPALREALESVSNGTVILVNWTDTIDHSRVYGRAALSFDGTADPNDENALNIVGWAEVAQRKSGEYYIARFGLERPDWEAIAARPEVAERLTPDPQHVPFRNALVEQPSLPHVKIEQGRLLTAPGSAEGDCLRIGANDTWRRYFEYRADDGSLRMAWALSIEMDENSCIAAFQVLAPEAAGVAVAALLAPPYLEREVYTGHKDLVFTQRPIEGGVPYSSIVSCKVNFCLEATVWVANREFPVEAITTATYYEDASGRLRRLSGPTLYELMSALRRLLAPGVLKLDDVARAALTAQLEMSCSRAKDGLSRMTVSFPVFSLRLLLSLEGLLTRLQRKGDRQLTLITDNSFCSAGLAHVLQQSGWMWNQAREAASSAKRKRKAVEESYFAITDESGAVKKDLTSISYSLETGELILKTPVLKFDAAFKHDKCSAPLPPCRIQGPAKFSPIGLKWVPRTTPDPTPAALVALYARGPNALWG